MKRICVFCGSKPGNQKVFRDQTIALGRGLADRSYELVFGGGSVGLMGVVADSVLESGGKVIGVIPEMLATVELLHPRVPDMRRVDSMHSRKALMAELADVFIALPGGYGTLEELFEIITWAQLGIHQKPIGLLNASRFFDPLIQMVDHMIAMDFIKPHNRDLFVVEDEPERLLERLATHKMPHVPRKLTSEET